MARDLWGQPASLGGEIVAAIPRFSLDAPAHPQKVPGLGRMRGTMFRKAIIAIMFGITCVSAGGCLCRADGVSRQAGAPGGKTGADSADYVAATAGKPTGLSGTLLLEDHATPLKDVRIVLRKSGQAPVLAEAYTDLIGNFTLTGALSHNSYLVEIDSPEYAGSLTITVEPDQDNWREIIAHKR